ncbi:MAG TPA: hypothetical protein VFO67_15745 [Gemmatimonadales bacterium]|nr:hypothetical protein [Gemmatimonadales bacterium]
MTSSTVHRDERTLAVENVSYRWAFHVFAYGLLLIVAYRSYAANEAAWDLLALVMIGSAVASLYQWTHDVLTKRSAAGVVVGMVLAALTAAVIVWLR